MREWTPRLRFRCFRLRGPQIYIQTSQFTMPPRLVRHGGLRQTGGSVCTLQQQGRRMKFIINVRRDSRYDTWSGSIGRNPVSACNSDVDRMFDGLDDKIRARFEFSNERPRYKDYHTFIWDCGCYRAREITRGWTPCLTRVTSQAIQQRFDNAKEKYLKIFITAY